MHLPRPLYNHGDTPATERHQPFAATAFESPDLPADEAPLSLLLPPDEEGEPESPELPEPEDDLSVLDFSEEDFSDEDFSDEDFSEAAAAVSR